jgi:hypothetical protein
MNEDSGGKGIAGLIKVARERGIVESGILALTRHYGTDVGHSANPVLADHHEFRPDIPDASSMAMPENMGKNRGEWRALSASPLTNQRPH